MRVLVTGSLGTIGAPLVAESRRRDHEVWGCDLAHDPDPQHVRTDVAEHRQVEEAFTRANPEVVVHLAAEFGRLNGELYTEQLWRTAMIGTRNVLDWCDRYGARLIFASSSEVYGEGAGEWLDELAIERTAPQLQNEYALSKWANEKQISIFAERHPDLPDPIVLRFFNVYGPPEPVHPFRSVVALFCAKALAGKTLPVYENYSRAFQFIDDFIPTVANAIERADQLRYRTYNIGGIDYRSVHELAKIVLDSVPLESRYYDQIELIPEDKHNVRNKRPDVSRAVRDLDHNPATLLEEGVPKTLAWMRDQEATWVR